MSFPLLQFPLQAKISNPVTDQSPILGRGIYMPQIPGNWPFKQWEMKRFAQKHNTLLGTGIEITTLLAILTDKQRDPLYICYTIHYIFSWHLCITYDKLALFSNCHSNFCLMKVKLYITQNVRHNGWQNDNKQTWSFKTNLWICIGQVKVQSKMYYYVKYHIYSYIVNTPKI